MSCKRVYKYRDYVDIDHIQIDQETVQKHRYRYSLFMGTDNTGTQKFKNNYQSTIQSLLNKLKGDNKNIYAMRFLSSENPWHPRNW